MVVSVKLTSINSPNFETGRCDMCGVIASASKPAGFPIEPALIAASTSAGGVRPSSLNIRKKMNNSPVIIRKSRCALSRYCVFGKHRFTNDDVRTPARHHASNNASVMHTLPATASTLTLIALPAFSRVVVQEHHLLAGSRCQRDQRRANGVLADLEHGDLR